MPAPHVLHRLLQLKIEHQERLLASLIMELGNTTGQYRRPVEAKIKRAELTLKLLRMKQGDFDGPDSDSDEETTEIISA